MAVVTHESIPPLRRMTAFVPLVSIYFKYNPANAKMQKPTIG